MLKYLKYFKYGKHFCFGECMNKFLMNVGGMLSRLMDDRLSRVGAQVNEILGTWVGPLLIAIGACGGIYVIVLGVAYARSESDSKRAEIKTRIFNLIIGIVTIGVLAALCIGLKWDKIVEMFDYAGE